MRKVELKNHGMQFGEGQPFFAFAGVNVIEDEGLVKEVGTELKQICADLKIPFVLKASFDKANRSSIHSFRGPGLEKGMQILETLKGDLNVPVITDIHEPEQAFLVGVVADILQIPAFLCRQTDLVAAAAKAAVKSDGLLHVKKGQFLAPWDCKNIVDKINEVTDSDRPITMLCERGTSFGYNNLVVDMLAFAAMKKLGVPVTYDAPHSVQLPGSGRGAGGEATATGGRRWGIEPLARAAVAAGADGVFLEFHPDPDQAKCDGPSCLPLGRARPLLESLQQISAISGRCQ